MNHLYNIIIKLVDKIFLPILSIFNKKINRFIKSRKIQSQKNYVDLHKKNKNIWFHAASLGEYELATAIIKTIQKDKSTRIILTFFSESGFKLKNRIKEIDYTYYLPLDTENKSRNFIEFINPKKVYFIKSEIWPNYIKELGRKKIDTYLIDGKFEKEDWYFKMPFKNFAKKILKTYKKILVQNKESKELLIKNNIKNVTVSGSLKFERVKMQIEENNRNKKIEDFLNKNNCIVCGSTWVEDEKLIIKYINEEKNDNIKWIIAPHDISSNNIERITNGLNKKPILFTDLKIDNAHNNVLIINTIGDLKKIYSYATISYIGGGMGNTGLHNILETCIFNNPTIIGKNYDKFIESKELVELEGVISVNNYEDFKKSLNKLINDKVHVKKIKKIISEYMNKNLGALSIINKETQI